MNSYPGKVSADVSLDELPDSGLSFEELEPREAPTYLLVTYEDNTT